LEEETSLDSVPIKLHQFAKFLFFKKLVLQFCLELGVEVFFEESLCSHPPDASVMKFQRLLVEFDNPPTSKAQSTNNQIK